ncbi:MAG: DUF1343 domain-containing protein [Chloroflexi bacterium]|nr:DUF1343 domain-containing protein [Chloroflexota bacterium]
MVKTGLEILISEKLSLVKDRRVGLVSHSAAILPDLTDSLEALMHTGVNITALFGPEHGYQGAAADAAAVGNSLEARFGLPIFSLYGNIREPNAEMLQNVDVLIVDLQDIGTRFYTFITTMVNVLRGAAKNQKEVVVLDRPNPINGVTIEGPMVKAGYESFIGIGGIPVRHGLTIGELALFMNEEIGAALTVIEMDGWKRAMWFDGTGLPWAATSPAMPHLATMTLFPGMCLFEGTNLSEGRGTSLPFEICGAPWLNKYELAQTLNDLNINGARFRPIRFMPVAHRFANEECEGVQVYVTKREAFEAFATGVHIVKACREQNREKFKFLDSSWEGAKPHFDLLAGTPQVREKLLTEKSVAEIEQIWASELKEFKEKRQKFLIYEQRLRW